MTVSVFSKAHMEQVLAQAKVKITPASKIWDAQRAYEKRLTTTMSKDKGNHIPSSSEGVFGQLTSCQHLPQLKVGEVNGKTPEPAAVQKRWKASRSLRRRRNHDRNPSASPDASHVNQNPPHPPTTKEWKQTRFRISSQTSRTRKRKRRKKVMRKSSETSRKHRKLRGGPDRHETRVLHKLHPVPVRRGKGLERKRRMSRWRISSRRPLLPQNRHRIPSLRRW